MPRLSTRLVSTRGCRPETATSTLTRRGNTQGCQFRDWQQDGLLGNTWVAGFGAGHCSRSQLNSGYHRGWLAPMDQLAGALCVTPAWAHPDATPARLASLAGTLNVASSLRAVSRLQCNLDTHPGYTPPYVHPGYTPPYIPFLVHPPRYPSRTPSLVHLPDTLGTLQACSARSRLPRAETSH